MKQISNQMIIVFFLALSLFVLYRLSTILTPFLLGALLAYLLNPLVKRLDKYMPHILSVTVVYFITFALLGILIVALYPLLQKQMSALISIAPQMLTWIQDRLIPWVTEFVNLNTLKSSIPATLSKTGWIFTTVLSSGYAFVSGMIDFVLTLVVTFYFLRDWDVLLKKIRNTLPKKVEPTIVSLAKESDAVLGEFLRGQLLVMLGLGLIYGIGLTVVGLPIGLMIGVIGGILSIVPYLGSLFVLLASTITALVQFSNWHDVVWVWLVFLIGQGVESYLLTPYLVGDRIGLHPVAVIFAVLAGGTLFGFFGVLLALPVAAVAMVLIRYLNHRYHSSHFYKDKPAQT